MSVVQVCCTVIGLQYPGLALFPKLIKGTILQRDTDGLLARTPPFPKLEQGESGAFETGLS